MNNKSTGSIGDRIEKLLKHNNLSKADLAKKLNISPNIITYWTKNQRIPTTEQLISLAETLDVSTDYILGLQPVPTTDVDLASVCKYLNLNETAINEIKKLTYDPFYRKIIEYFTYSGNHVSEITYENRSKLHLLLHLILDMNSRLNIQLSYAKALKELPLNYIDTLTDNNSDYRKFWENDEKIIVDLFSIQESTKKYVNDFLSEKIQEVNEFKKIIPSATSPVLSAIEQKELFLVSDNNDNE